MIGQEVYEKHLIKYMIVTKLGEGAKKLLDSEQSLLGDDGLPKIVTPPPRKNKSEDPSESLANDTQDSCPSVKKPMLDESEQTPTIPEDSSNEIAPEPNTVAATLPTTIAATPSD